MDPQDGPADEMGIEEDVPPWYIMDYLPPRVWSDEELQLVRRLSRELRVHSLIVSLLEDYEPAVGHEQLDDLSRRLLTALQPHASIIMGSARFLIDIIVVAFTRLIAYEETFLGSPVEILTTVTRTEPALAHVVGRAVQRFILWHQSRPGIFPNCLTIYLEGNCPLQGQPNSPLTTIQFNELATYFGTRKPIYIHLALNCLIEMDQHLAYFRTGIMTEDKLRTILRTGWLYLVLMGN